MDKDTNLFGDSCIHCIAKDSEERIRRPMGHTLLASNPSEVLRFEFCYIGESSCSKPYVLVLKNGMSSCVRFDPCETADSDTTTEALLDWFCNFSVVPQCVSDLGLHFKNELMKLFQKRLRTNHHFTLPYCPWSNSTMTVVYRELTRYMRALRL